MEHESERIERHIEAKKEQLGRNLDELGTRVRSTLDWRSHYERNPWLFLSVAFCGSAAASAMISGGRGSFSQHSGFGRTWTNVQGALMSVAAQYAQNLMEEVIPGFREEFQARAERHHV